VAVALSVRGLTKTYKGGKEALRGVDLVVGEGELVGLLGPNGAGKSTLTKIACGLVQASDGELTVAGARAGSVEARRATGYLAELFRFPGWLTATELLELHQRLAGSAGGAGERAELLELVGLGDARAVRVEAMSKGMQQRLGIAQAMIGAPSLLLLDEPTSALDPAGRRVVRELLVELRERGIGVMLNSHLLGEVERVCDAVTIIDDGRVVAAGSPAELAGARVVEIETERGLIRREGVDREEIPAIVRELVAEGRDVFAVRETGSSLEDAYMQVVGSGDIGRPAPEEES
jgi:ABC-2 type transport system ATP-binding protein